MKGFIKVESYPQYKPVRWINSRVDEFKVWCGPMFKAIEQVVYDMMPEFIKHTPVPDRPAKINRLDDNIFTHKYATDWTSMEKHFKARVMRALEFPLYDHMLSNLPRRDRNFLFTILSGTNIITGMHGISAKVHATRMSGEMNTSLGNGWCNRLVSKFIVEVLKKGKFVGYVEGDDSIFASSVEVTTEDYHRLGFDVKINEFDTASEASFCGIISAADGSLIRDPIRVLQTFGWTSSFISSGERVMMELLRAKAMSLAFECPACPIVTALAEAALKYTRGVTPRFVSDGYHDFSIIPRDEKHINCNKPSAAARALMEKKFGISASLQEYIEELIKLHDFDRIATILPASQNSWNYEQLYVATG